MQVAISVSATDGPILSMLSEMLWHALCMHALITKSEEYTISALSYTLQNSMVIQPMNMVISVACVFSQHLALNTFTECAKCA